ncbi:MAG: hypothetical protein HY075_00350, partial [Deltaproteobacteria bacterium]|nr:hypothetical protein [Deltaproteobacteria bacterium]
MNFTFRFATLSLFLVSAATALAGPDSHYDELFDESGEVRAHYAEVFKIYSRLSKEQRERIRKKSVKDFSGDNALLPLPRVIPEDEFEGTLKKGIEQRGTALRMFIEDYFSGK